MKTPVLAFVIVVGLLSNPSVRADTPGSAPLTCPDLFLGLTSDETWRASMALGFATKNLELGSVTVFLNVEGVRLAVRNRRLPHDTYGLTGRTTQQALRKFLRRGGTVIVCPSCLERSGFTPQQLIQGVYLGGPVPEILHCSDTQMSY